MPSLGNQEFIRDMNSRIVLREIMNSEPISRAELAKVLGLTKATVSSIVQNFIDENYVIEIGSMDTQKGRKPILLQFNADCAFTLSVDLNIDTLSILISNLKGEKCLIFQYPNPVEHADFGTLLCEYIADAMAHCPASTYGIVGIAVGIHGIVHNNEILFTPYYKLSNFNLRQCLEEHFDIPVFIENEANFSAIGEKAFYYNYPNLINISVHAGIGLGIIMDDHLFTGLNGYAGEFGHTIVVPGGKSCPCGNNGCFEQYASERAILERYRQCIGKPEATISDLCEAFLNHNHYAIECIEVFEYYMSIGLNNILNIFNPDIVIINSVFTMNIPQLTQRISARLKGALTKQSLFVPSMLQDMAILLGGACVCIKNFLKIDDPQFKLYKDS